MLRALITVIAVFSIQANARFLLGEFAGKGKMTYKDARGYISNDSCDIAINANYSAQDGTFSYDFGYLCLSEFSGGVNAPSNDSFFKLKVDAQNQLYLIDVKTGQASATPVGYKTGNRFDVTMVQESIVDIKWYPDLGQRFRNSNYDCRLIDREKVTLRKTMTYSFELNGKTVNYSRKIVSDVLPFFMSKYCYENHVAELSKYQIAIEHTAILNAQ